VKHVLVDKAVLDKLLRKAWDMFELLAEDSGYTERYLEPESELVMLAVQAGLRIPGPMAPGTVPPAPPHGRFQGSVPCAPCFRDERGKVRCSADGKVIYGTQSAASKAVALIAQRHPMRVYLGPCGHWHLSTDRKALTSGCGTVFIDDRQES
jgi:hypothetical protein